MFGMQMAITSQEESSVWIGAFDIESLDFEGDGKVFQFPRGPLCGTTYCNVEGFEFMDECGTGLLALASMMAGYAHID